MTDTAQQTRDKIQEALASIEEPGGEAGVLVGLARERLNSAIMIMDAVIKAETVPEVVAAIQDAQAQGAEDAQADQPSEVPSTDAPAA